MTLFINEIIFQDWSKEIARRLINSGVNLNNWSRDPVILRDSDRWVLGYFRGLSKADQALLLSYIRIEIDA